MLSFTIGQFYTKATTFSRFGLNCHSSSHSFDAFSHDRQTNACSWILGGAMQALEDAEDSFVIFGGNTDAIIFDADFNAHSIIAGKNFDFWRKTVPRKFQS